MPPAQQKNPERPVEDVQMEDVQEALQKDVGGDVEMQDDGKASGGDKTDEQKKEDPVVTIANGSISSPFQLATGLRLT